MIIVRRWMKRDIFLNVTNQSKYDLPFYKSHEL